MDDTVQISKVPGSDLAHQQSSVTVITINLKNMAHFKKK